MLNFTINEDYVYAGAETSATLAPQEQCQALYKGVEKEVTFTAEADESQEIYHRPDLSLTIEGEINPLKQSTIDVTNQLTKAVVFDEEGKADIKLRYPEAGKTKITAKIDSLSGTDNLITIPKGLCVAIRSSCNAESNYAECQPFAAAGEHFPVPVIVTAHGLPTLGGSVCGTSALRNYVQKVDLSLELLAPKPGAQGQLSFDNYMHNDQGHDTNENKEITVSKDGHNQLQQSISEVGVFNITAGLDPDGTYYGISNTHIAAGTSKPIGRIYPDRFVLDSGEVESKNVGTDIESYMGQPFNVDFTVSAVNKLGATTENYVGDFAKGTVQLNAFVGSENVNSRLSPKITEPMPNWTNGQLSFPSVNNSGHVTFTRNSTKQDGPYDLEFMLGLDDGEDINNDQKSGLSKLFDRRNNENDNNCSQSAGCDALLLGKQTVRHGRIQAPNQVLRPVNEPASVPLRIEYWDAAKDNWQVFTEDNWTTLTMTGNTDKVSFPENDYVHPTLTVNDQVAVEAGLDDGEGSGTHSSATMVDGQLNLNVGAPGVASIIKYQLNLNGLPWLKPLNNAANEGQIRFGNSPGNSSVIYRREQ